jgi:hypothetical protein
MIARIAEFTKHEQAGMKVTIKNDLETEVYTLQEFENKKDEKLNELENLKRVLNIDRNDYIKYGWERDIILIVGFILILISKIYQWSS